MTEHPVPKPSNWMEPQRQQGRAKEALPKAISDELRSPKPNEEVLHALLRKGDRERTLSALGAALRERMNAPLRAEDVREESLSNRRAALADFPP